MVADSSSDQRPVIHASEILAKIGRGEPIEYYDVIIEGWIDLNLILGGLDLPKEHVDRTEFEKKIGLSDEMKIISSQIKVYNSEIRGYLDFSNVHFKNEVFFKSTKFTGKANFWGAKFTENAGFPEADFGDTANFRGAKFEKIANFIFVKFSGGYADFWGAQFTGGDAIFGGAKFGMGANFFRARFTGGDADFACAKFGGDTCFDDTEFTGGDAIFGGTEFAGDAGFTGAKFVGNASFWQAKFGGIADFSKATFNNKLNITRLKFYRLDLNWKMIENNLVYDGPAYLALIKNFKLLEQFGDAGDCYYQYRKESQARKKWYSEENRLIEFLISCYSWISANIKRISDYLSWIHDYPPFTWIHRFNWSKLLDWIGFVSCGYGVRIQPIILWVLSSVLGFTLLYKLLPQSRGGIAESGPSTVTMETVNNSTLLFTFSSGDGAVSPSWGECLYFSFTALTGGTPDGLHPVGLCKYAVMIEGVLGYLFLALFVVVLARKIIR